ncbi:hypothetical protein ACFJGW_04280 [Burkholderiaceae bacterium UC74_6]
MKWLAGVVLALVAWTAQAHEDRLIEWRPDGSLAGLPAMYAPARLHANFRPIGDATRLIALQMRIGANSVQLPACLLGSLLSEKREQISLLASWEHDEAVLPHYLALRAADADGFYELLFNLHTARLMAIRFHLQRPDGGRDFSIDLKARCAADELAGVTAD